MAEASAAAGPKGSSIDPAVARPARDRVGSAIPIIIGLIAVLGAFLTWRSVSLSGQAGDADRRAVLDTTSLQKQQLFAEATLSFDLVSFAEYRANLSAAENLEESVEAGDDANGSLARQAATYRALAANILTSFRLDSGYVSGSTAADVTFDEARRRDDLSRANPYVTTLTDPRESASDGDRLYQRHLRMIAFIVGLTGAIVVLTAAQLVSGARRLLLAGGGSLAGTALVVVALVGDK